MSNSIDNQTAEITGLQVSIQAIVATACNQAKINEEFQPLLETESLVKLAIRTGQDYNCLQHSGVQTQLLQQLADHSNLDFSKELMDFKSESYRWIDETAKRSPTRKAERNASSSRIVANINHKSKIEELKEALEKGRQNKENRVRWDRVEYPSSMIC